MRSHRIKSEQLRALVRKLDKTKIREHKFKDEIFRQQMDIANLTYDLEKYEKLSSGLESEVRAQVKLTDRISGLLHTVSMLKSRNLRGVRTQRDLEEKIKALVKEKEAFRKRCGIERSLREQRERELQDFSNLKVQKQKLEKRLNINRERILQFKSREADLESKVKRLHVSMAAQLEEMKVLKGKLEHQVIECDSLQRRVDLLSDLPETVNTLTGQNQDLKTEIQLQKDQIRSDRTQLTRLRIKHKVDKAKMEEMSRALASCVEAREQLEAMSRELVKAQGDAWKKGHLIRKLHEETADLREKLKNNQGQFKEETNLKQKENMQLQQRIERHKKLQRQYLLQIADLKKQKDLLTENVASLQAQLRQSQAKLSEQELMVAKLDSLVEEMTVGLDRAEAKINSLKIQLDMLQGEKSRVEAACKERQKQQERREKQSTRLNGQLQSKNQELRKQVRVLQHRLNQHTAWLNQAHDERNQRDKRITDLQVENQTLGREINDLRGSVGELEAQMRMKVFLHPPKPEGDELGPLSKYDYQGITIALRNLVEQQNEQLKERDLEIEGLKTSLARRPEDAVLKLNQTRWQVRELKNKVMAERGLQYALEHQNRELKEDVTALKEQVVRLRPHMIRLPAPAPPQAGDDDRLLRRRHASVLPPINLMYKADWKQ